MTLEFYHRSRPLFVCDRVADPPSGHGIGLRKTSSYTDEIAQFRRQYRGSENLAGRIGKEEVALVGQNVDSTFGANFNDLSHFAGRYNAARRVIRRIDYQQAGLVGDGTPNLVCG